MGIEPPYFARRREAGTGVTCRGVTTGGWPPRGSSARPGGLWWKAGRLRTGALRLPAPVSALVFGLLCPRNLEGTPGTMPDRSAVRQGPPHPNFGLGAPAGRWVSGGAEHGGRTPMRELPDAATVGTCSRPSTPGLPVSAHSVLDVVPQLPGQSAAAALRETAEVAQAADDLGYRRFWFGEQHGVRGIGSATSGRACRDPGRTDGPDPAGLGRRPADEPPAARHRRAVRRAGSGVPEPDRPGCRPAAEAWRPVRRPHSAAAARDSVPAAAGRAVRLPARRTARARAGGRRTACTGRVAATCLRPGRSARGAAATAAVRGLPVFLAHHCAAATTARGRGGVPGSLRGDRAHGEAVPRGDGRCGRGGLRGRGDHPVRGVRAGEVAARYRRRPGRLRPS